MVDDGLVDRLGSAAVARPRAHGLAGEENPSSRVEPMTTWEYVTVPLITHATKQILDQWGQDGWELVQVVPGPTGSDNLVAYMKRPRT